MIKISRISSPLKDKIKNLEECSQLSGDGVFEGKYSTSGSIIIRNKLKHPLIKKIRGRGLMLAIILESVEIADRLVIKAKKNGLLLFWLLIEKRAVRITPPLTITEKDISLGCDIIIQQLNNISKDVN